MKLKWLLVTESSVPLIESIMVGDLSVQVEIVKTHLWLRFAFLSFLLVFSLGFFRHFDFFFKKMKATRSASKVLKISLLWPLNDFCGFGVFSLMRISTVFNNET